MTETRPGFIARGGLWAIAQFLLKTAVVALGLWCRGDWSQRWPVVGGWFLLGAGLLIFVAGWVVLGRNLTPFPQPRPDGAFVQHGIYARVRHPLYTGVTLMAVGWALLCESLAALGTALALLPFFYAKTRREERWLCTRFPGYAEYMKRVPAFLPGRRRERT